MQASWRNLKGPARTLATSATILLIASALGGIQAGVVLILGPAFGSGPTRDILLKPFVLAGYLEACAMFFSLIFIVGSIICLIFYRPYLFLRAKIRARRDPNAEDDQTWQGPVYLAPGHNRDEDGSPD